MDPLSKPGGQIPFVPPRENVPEQSAIVRFLNGLRRLCRCIPILKYFMSAGVSTHTPDTDIRGRNVHRPGDALAEGENHEVKLQVQTHVNARALITWIKSLKESSDSKNVQFSEETLQHLKRVNWEDVEHVQTATGHLVNIEGARYRTVLDITRDGRQFVSKAGFVLENSVDQAIVGDVKVKKKPDVL